MTSRTDSMLQSESLHATAVAPPLLYLCGLLPRRSYLPPPTDDSLGPQLSEPTEEEEPTDPESPVTVPNRHPDRYSAAIRSACLALVAQGVPVGGVARRFRISQRVVRGWLKKEAHVVARIAAT
jgi:hypothetical protein